MEKALVPKMPCLSPSRWSTQERDPKARSFSFSLSNLPPGPRLSSHFPPSRLRKSYNLGEGSVSPFKCPLEWGGHSLGPSRFVFHECCSMEKLLPPCNFPRALYDVEVTQQDATPFRSMTSTGHMFPCLSSHLFFFFPILITRNWTML